MGLMCRVLLVSRAGYYAWRRRLLSARAERRTRLITQIRQVHLESRETYGSPRVHRELKARGEKCCENTVAKLMRQEQVQSTVRRRFVVRTTDSRHAHAVAENLLDQAFAQERANQAWGADITYIATDEGWLYLAAVIDLYSRRVVGWATAEHLRAELCQDALAMAITQRRPPAGLLHHSDRGVQYACDDYQAVLASQDMRPSMSRTGNCYDNAVVESFFATLKTELVYASHYATRTQARQSLFEYIEVFYNRQRRHSSLGYVSPAEFEQVDRHKQKLHRDQATKGTGKRVEGARGRGDLRLPRKDPHRAAQPLLIH